MQTQPTKDVRGLRKRAEFPRGINSSADPSIPDMKIDSRSIFRHELPPWNLFREKEAADVVFQALLSNANQELSRLLRDIRTGTQVGLNRDTPSRRISDLLKRAVRCATKQYMLQAELGNLAFTDELTGLYNRRAFRTLAERQLKLARRSCRGMLLFFIDVDGLKQINDCFGHAEGDRALRCTAQTLKKTFRDSDVIARLGGDELAVLAVEASGHSDAKVVSRLNKYLDAINAEHPEYAISLSVGVARFDYGRPTSIRDLMAQADRAMYEQKRSRSRCRIAVGMDYPC